MPDMVVCFSLYKVPQVPKCPSISIVVLKGCGGYMLPDDDKTIFVKRDDDIVYVAKGVGLPSGDKPNRR
jgi:hypothetical protein